MGAKYWVKRVTQYLAIDIVLDASAGKCIHYKIGGCSLSYDSCNRSSMRKMGVCLED